ncbi:hypothetical protein K461DRAFT_323137 [Myriangium duriaei CBS 260.36]|uniref:DUF4045 domain-containing protein n=1 Tax=Myriangium duriaei CBS 260.36 TaxID=1168546 RepID=A0A9P4MKF8_9PEZI|nr:hypothetical protein K461DRAFT_323137 [Myriangium duriaei CBS 260.36]
MADSDLDPQAFLKTVRDLSDKRQREDNERYEKLEAQILQDRTARLERKAERERSLSPEKTPTSVRSFDIRTPVNASSPAGSRHASPTRELSREDSVRSFRSDRASPAPVERPVSPTKTASPGAAMPSRANTMSWQRRPQSGARSRPLSVLAAENSASRASPEPNFDARPGSRDEPSQQDIAKSLSMKDPTWFKQTPDRGVGSAAYRRSREEEEDTVSGAEKRHLPGLSSQMPATQVVSPPSTSPEREALAALEAAKPTLSGASAAHRESTPELEKAAFGRTIPSLQSRPSVNRPTSPTRGMGGFVESAMMKRTDSVSKRWSTQPTGLMRTDSTASLRSGYGSVRNSMASPSSAPKLESARSSAEPASRPTSSHSTVSAMSNLTLQELPEPGDKPLRTGSFHSRSKSHASLRDPPKSTSNLPPTFSPPLSPSKRFSPTKSSWLESALARPESPTKQMSPSSQGQPAWMVELSKTKQQRNSTATFASQEEPVLETASVKSFQPFKASATQVGSGAAFKSLSRDLTPTDLPKRNFTPPTKAKPAALAGKPSKEGLRISGTTESPAVHERQEEAFFGQGGSFADSPELPSIEKFEAQASKPRTTSVSDKIKPETPSKTDFRANLSSRPRSTEKDNAAAPEFMNALGKLKKSNTQNYVAPDVLKNNILRGKAGLTVTGGPQKTQRVDEFKDSILKKKAEMKEKAPEPSAKPSHKSPQPAPTPEALLIKKGLQRSDSSNLSVPSPTPRRDITPEALARHKTLRAKPQPPSSEKQTKLSETPANAPFTTSSTSSPKLGATPVSIQSSPSKDEPIQLKRSDVSKPIETSTNKVMSQPIQKPMEEAVEKPVEVTTTTKPSTSVKSNNFADRFNPALAGLLARGPPPPTSSSPPKASIDMGGSPSSSRPSESSRDVQDTKGKELTHMTKDRARGPKRRKPKAASQPEVAPTQPPTAPSSLSVSKRGQTEDRPVSTNAPVQPKPKSAAVRTLSMTLSDKAGEKNKPPTPTKSATFPTSATASSPSKPSGPRLLDSKIQTPTSEISSPITRNSITPTSNAKESASSAIAGALDDDKENAEALPSVKNAAAMWGKPEQDKSSPVRSMPIKLPSKQDEEAAMRSAGLLSGSSMRYQASKPEGLGIETTKSESPKSSKYPLSPPSSGGVPPKPAKSSRIVSQSLGDAPIVQVESAVATPTTPKQPASRAEQLMREFFGTLPEFATRLQLDPQSVLTDSASTPPVRTLRKTIQLLTDNGKLMPLPTEKEYILFSSSIYIVSHVYGSSSGQRQMDVFLWAGSDVNSSAIDDAQIFAKRVAKDTAQGSRSMPTVTVIKQAREPAGFFQALGGIVIIRRGSHANTATKPYVLCGRPHVGHVAFDEVDMKLTSLHSIFPYIIVNPRTIQDTQVYLWKGRACGPETVGSARLISMDLASSDVIETTEGSEPANFLSLFGSSAPRDSSSQTIQVSPSDKLAPRLFRFDVLQPRRHSSSFFGLFKPRQATDSPRPGSSHRPTSAASNRSLTTPPQDDSPTMETTELAPFAQDDFEPEHVYMLDCIASVLVIPGPLLAAPSSGPPSRSPDPGAGADSKWEARLAQACLFAHDYALLAAGLQDRPGVPAVKLVLGDMPGPAKWLFRGWDEGRGLWGAAGLMAGRSRGEGGVVGVQEVLDVCCGR